MKQGENIFSALLINKHSDPIVVSFSSNKGLLAPSSHPGMATISYPKIFRPYRRAFLRIDRIQYKETAFIPILNALKKWTHLL
ncbi:hypothetical protein COMNV_01342 [Commensalibacter sp. Nvir]|uniref:hypothetical protein n=1 Tax=Commensalibacter sp. Nvir TaxID=3069817 RepID=UPI002D25D2B5|nr:hypothetical protein COMNV_01342 [Commensalibacter sp. Nvir]